MEDLKDRMTEEPLHRNNYRRRPVCGCGIAKYRAVVCGSLMELPSASLVLVLVLVIVLRQKQGQGLSCILVRVLVLG